MCSSDLREKKSPEKNQRYIGPRKFDELSRELLFKMIGARFPDQNQKSRKFPNLPNVVSNSLGAHCRNSVDSVMHTVSTTHSDGSSEHSPWVIASSSGKESKKN